jgi:hypothetical protein
MTFPVRSALFIASILPQVCAERERPAEISKLSLHPAFSSQFRVSLAPHACG